MAHKTHAYTIPASISEHVSDVYPISTFGTIRHFAHIDEIETQKRAEEHDSKRSVANKRATPSSCSTSLVTSACYRALYGFDTYSPVAAVTTPNVGM